MLRIAVDRILDIEAVSYTHLASGAPKISPTNQEELLQLVPNSNSRIRPVATPTADVYKRQMVHNGIEYGDMQLIAESYFAMKHLLALKNEQIDVYKRQDWE